jgi:phosphatidate phosphatase APP1
VASRLRRRHTLLHRLRRRRPGLRIDAYHGYGTEDALYLKGRVLRDPGVRLLDPGSGRFHNLKNMVRRALSDEVPHARVQAELGGSRAEAQADASGYFGIVLKRASLPASASGWQEVVLTLLEPQPSTGHPVHARARVLLPRADAEFGVISDIDDTVVRTESTNWLRMMRIVLLSSAQSRLPLEHAGRLLRALQEGSDGGRRNPIFYLSSSPWNLFDLLSEFFRVHDIPEGPLLLRDWTYSPRKLLGGGHRAHKLVRIRHLFDLYPQQKWVLIGDSGQADPEIYCEAVREYPGRVLAIYIRNVTRRRREAEVLRLAAALLAGSGVEMLFMRDKTEAAVHAAARGLITTAALRSISGRAAGAA